jgi:long-chain acyl-CoA synthetase
MEVTRTFDILARYEELFSDKENLLLAKKDGQWVNYSTKDYIETANHFSYGLLEMGFRKGDKIATISNNRPEWNFVDMGSAQAGVVHVPIYPTISNEEFRYILENSDARILIVSDKALYDTLKTVCEKVPGVEGLYTFNEIAGAKHWSEIAELGKKNADKHRETLEKVKQSIDPEETVSLIYTSGTTGVSKGVMLSHKNFMSNVKATIHLFDVTPDFRVLSFLPLCHVFERMVNYFYQYSGVSIHYAESMATIADNMREIKVNLFVSVPRVLERVYDKIIGKGKSLSGVKKALFFWAVGLGLKYKEKNNGWWYNFRLKIARKLIFSKWQAALGGEVKYVISGGAALQVRLARIFWAAGIPVYEGYGLTETAPVISVNTPSIPDGVRFGTVGPVVEGVTVKIAEDGEILAKGPNVMQGYYKAPELTAQVIDEDGWFHTGDIGMLVDDNFLKITDRKKEIFKNSAGKYVAPQPIENKLKESFFIEQAMVVGENEKFVSALIVPSFEYLHNWASLHKVNYRDNEELISKPEVVSRIQKEINEVNQNLAAHEQIKRFRLVKDEWSTATGELSPTLKLRRNIVYEKYDHILQEIFGHGQLQDEAEMLDKMKKKAVKSNGK